jgi:hypothetical protein
MKRVIRFLEEIPLGGEHREEGLSLIKDMLDHMELKPKHLRHILGKSSPLKEEIELFMLK